MLTKIILLNFTKIMKHRNSLCENYLEKYIVRFVYVTCNIRKYFYLNIILIFLLDIFIFIYVFLF